MSRLLRGRKEKTWETRMRRNYYDVIRHLGISEIGRNKMALMEAVICAAKQKETDLERVYGETASRLGVNVETIKREIKEALYDSWNEHRCTYGEAQGPALRELYLGEKYAKIKEPETFIFKIAHYIKTQR